MRRGEQTIVRVAPLAAADIDRLIELATEIWRAHYTDIIGAAQIEYMLAQRYTPEILRTELGRGNLWWDQLLVNDTMSAFASYFLTVNPGEMKLDKLYVRQSHQRQGYAGMLLDRALGVARAFGCGELTLAVNKRNVKAIAAYEKYGFRITDEVVKDIGGGFVMDDYVMVKAVLPDEN